MRIHKFKVTDNWLVDIYDEKGFIKKEYGDQAYYKDDHAVMPLKLWKGGPVAVNIKAKMQHLMSPLEKKGNKDRKKNYIKGRNKKYGSKLPIAQQKAMKTKNKFSESYMMEQMLYEGKVEKAAESFLSDMVKKSPWKGKVYIAGGYGMVGSAIERRLLDSGYNNIIKTNSRELDQILGVSNSMVTPIFRC